MPGCPCPTARAAPSVSRGDRRVLITAGANGIGLVMARAFAALGDRVWVTDVDAAALAALPLGVRGTLCDAAGEAAMELLFAEVARDWGGLDVAIANAGIKGPTAAIEEMPLEGWHQCLGVNLDGAMLLARGAARLMKPAGKGVILFISSTSRPVRHSLPGTLCGGEMGRHRADEDGGDGAWGRMGSVPTRSVRAAVNGPRIDRVIEAEAAAKGMTPEAVRQGYAAGTALKRLTDPEDVADMAVYLASDARAWSRARRWRWTA
jgi:NAD(P)-dependent dehydrogenase (short-subunit alcohol dehydrogenase family)